MPQANFGEKLKNLRKNLGKSQSEVAQEIAEQFPKELRISQKTLSDLELRESVPRGEVLEVLASYFQVSPTYFFEASNREKVDLARNYLKGLRGRAVGGASLQARSSDRQYEDDDISQSLKNLRNEQPSDDSDLLDS